MSDELDRELHRQFASFSQIDDLVTKQGKYSQSYYFTEELYN